MASGAEYSRRKVGVHLVASERSGGMVVFGVAAMGLSTGSKGNDPGRFLRYSPVSVPGRAAQKTPREERGPGSVDRPAVLVRAE